MSDMALIHRYPLTTIYFLYSLLMIGVTSWR